MVSQGDIVYVDFNPALGSEQKGNRPALVVSNSIYHEKTDGFVIVIPITSTESHGYPMHIKLDDRTRIHGELMCEQLKTMDTKVRELKKVEELPNDLLDKTLKIIKLVF